MLHLNHDTSRRLDIGAVDFSIWRDVTDFSTVFRKKVLPVAMPSGFVFPPRIAIPAARVSPMMDDTRSAFGNHRRAAGRTTAPPVGGGLTALIVNYGVLQIVFPEVVGLILTITVDALCIDSTSL